MYATQKWQQYLQRDRCRHGRRHRVLCQHTSLLDAWDQWCYPTKYHTHMLPSMISDVTLPCAIPHLHPHVTNVLCTTYMCIFYWWLSTLLTLTVFISSKTCHTHRSSTLLGDDPSVRMSTLVPGLWWWRWWWWLLLLIIITALDCHYYPQGNINLPSLSP